MSMFMFKFTVYLNLNYKHLVRNKALLISKGMLTRKEKLNVFKINLQSKSKFYEKVRNPDWELSVTLINKVTQLGVGRYMIV